MLTLRTIQLNLRDGSAGIELLSALYKILLFLAWRSGSFNRTSILFVLIIKLWPSAWLLLFVGIAHIVAWTQPATKAIITIRKAGCIVGIGVWCSFLYDLTVGGVTAVGLVLVLIVLFLFVAVMRRTYPAI